MNEMVERVARTIANTQLLRKYVGHLENIGCAIEIDRIWPEFIPEARAAIASIREPTKEMCEAGLNTGAVGNDDFYIRERHFAKVWQAMIDEMLK